MNKDKIIDADFKVKEEKKVRTEEEIFNEMNKTINNFSIPEKRNFKKAEKIKARILQKEKLNNGSHQLENSLENDKKIYTNYMKNLGLLEYFTELKEVEQNEG